MWKIGENSDGRMQKKWGGMSLGSFRVRATVTLERLMTLFHMNDVHQGM